MLAGKCQRPHQLPSWTPNRAVDALPWGSRVKESTATKRREGGGAAVNTIVPAYGSMVHGPAS